MKNLFCKIYFTDGIYLTDFWGGIYICFNMKFKF